MKALKDKKKFGGNSVISKNHKCKSFGVGDGKEWRKSIRKETKRLQHSLLKGIPLSEEDIKN